MLLPLWLNLKTFCPLKQHVRLCSALVLKEVSIFKEITFPGNWGEGYRTTGSITETSGSLERSRVLPRPHTALEKGFWPTSGAALERGFWLTSGTVLERGFWPTSGSGISCSLSEFFGVLPSYLPLFHLPWVGVQVLFVSFGLELVFPRFRAPFQAFCVFSPLRVRQRLLPNFHFIKCLLLQLGWGSVP